MNTTLLEVLSLSSHLRNLSQRMISVKTSEAGHLVF